MKETSKLLMGASLVMMVSLGVVLALLLVLLAELYCSLLVRNRRLRAEANAATASTTTTTAAAATTNAPSLQSQLEAPTPFGSLYAQGVLQAPRNLLFPILSKEENEDSHKQQKPECSHEIRIGEEPNSSRSPVFSPQLTQEEGRKSGSSAAGEHLVYISNPIYNNQVATPFETPDTSPSRLGISPSSSDNDDIVEASKSSLSSLPMTPPLTPMKKLPEQACSVSLRDARSLGTSGSGSDSVNGPSSSSSGSPRTSPSW